MIHIAIRVRELVSSNVDTLVSKAGDQHKMQRLLQSEIEEALIGLHGDVAKLRRAHERQIKAAAKQADIAEEWTSKAKTAIDHGREDLARGALLARESDRKKAEAMQAELNTLEEQIAEMDGAITELESKRESVSERIAAAQSTADTSADLNTSGDSRTARKLDRINALGRRADFAVGEIDEAHPDNVDAEIALLSQASAIDAELKAMKAPATAKRIRKKAK